MLVTSTANMSTGVTTKHLLTVRAWTPGQHQTNLDCCITQRKRPVFSLTGGTSAPTQTLAFASFGQDNRLSDRRVLGKFPRSQHRPTLITPPRLKVPVHSDPVKLWNFRKADWKRFCLLTDESVERLPPPDTLNIERGCQHACESQYPRANILSHVAIARTMCHAGTKSVKPSSSGFTGGQGPGPNAPHQRGPPNMFMCLATCGICACHFVIFNEKGLFVDAADCPPVHDIFVFAV